MDERLEPPGELGKRLGLLQATERGDHCLEAEHAGEDPARVDLRWVRRRHEEDALERTPELARVDGRRFGVEEDREEGVTSGDGLQRGCLCPNEAGELIEVAQERQHGESVRGRSGALAILVERGSSTALALAPYRPARDRVPQSSATTRRSAARRVVLAESRRWGPADGRISSSTLYRTQVLSH